MVLMTGRWSPVIGPTKHFVYTFSISNICWSLILGVAYIIILFLNINDINYAY